MASAAVIPLYYNEVVRFTQNNVSDLGINPVNLLNLESLKNQIYKYLNILSIAKKETI